MRVKFIIKKYFQNNFKTNNFLVLFILLLQLAFKYIVKVKIT